ncbi:hypothetical protein [Alicyclobacillus acidoterrestris]|nr:hypothetical protein [Alicyclobacillus acidoterrestris]EPZ52539.1 hypothetical protein N007_02835 [Alicyclobacillus acidoterrestris ATCC 49025]
MGASGAPGADRQWAGGGAASGEAAAGRRESRIVARSLAQMSY